MATTRPAPPEGRAREKRSVSILSRSTARPRIKEPRHRRQPVRAGFLCGAVGHEQKQGEEESGDYLGFICATIEVCERYDTQILSSKSTPTAGNVNVSDFPPASLKGKSYISLDLGLSVTTGSQDGVARSAPEAFLPRSEFPA